jgi:hypothetical protein
MEMKKAMLTTALGLALTAGVQASVVTVDSSTAIPGGGSFNFDSIDFLETDPISYYIDSGNGNGGAVDGYVNSGEFVFDFGSDIIAGQLSGPSGNLGLGGNDYGFVADYLLIGEAVVVSSAEANLSNYVDITSGVLGITADQYVAQALSDSANCTNTNAVVFCSLYGAVIADDGTYNVDPTDGDFLAANITDGLFNLFLTDVNGDRVGLAASFSVTGTDIIATNEVNLRIFGEAIQAEDDILFDLYGKSFADIIADATQMNPTFSVSTTLQTPSANSEPGVFTSAEVGQTNPADSGLYYYTDDGFNVWDITSTTNDCSSAPTGTAFGGCSSLIGDPSVADDEWDRLKGLIRDAAGCTNENNCTLDVLARTTTLDANATINVNAPGTLFLSGIALMFLGLRRKFS